MIRTLKIAVILAAAAPLSAPAMAQAMAAPATATRLDVVATGEVMRVPDIAIINAGVVTRAATATAAIQQNATRMASVRKALRAAGIEDRDIQTSSISLNPDYRYADNQPPVLTGYQANNSVSVRFRDIARTGAILDALVSQGANQINGPTLTIDKPEDALDEARVAALARAKAKADLYARQLGKSVGRIILVSESGGGMPGPVPMPMFARVAAQDATKIDPGEQSLSVTLSVSFELL